MGRPLKWDRSKYWGKRTEEYSRPQEKRSRLERQADELLAKAESMNRPKRWKSAKSNRSANPNAAPSGRPRIIDNPAVAFVTLKYPDGNIRTIGRQCPWFAEAMAEARE